ncbi:MAG TPA: glucose-6-phosphate dehydrogenase [Gemmatimonadales bacterium]|nr:glucose-6-phosphate dehydrogenase [Gemmatimonadales bacterium]
MIERLVLFGATGDLAGRYLLPALAALQAAGELPADFAVVGTARQKLDDAAFGRLAAERLAEHAADVPAPARDALVSALRYRPADLADPASVAPLLRDGAAPSDPLAAYLALPPRLFPTTVDSLAAAGLPAGSRIAVEKPFGDDLASAVALERQLTRVVGETDAATVFRVDHVLGMATVQNLPGLRFANPLLEAVWNGAHVERIEILWEETLALEDRAGYYDAAGALKDVMQNHMLQVLALLAMEPPATLGARDLHERKLALLRSLRPPRPDELAAKTRRARYTAGPGVPAYADEPGVDPARGTETLAEVTLTLDAPRWGGTPVVLRAGKALAERRKEAVVRFRPPTQGPFAAHPAMRGAELRIGLDGHEDLRLHLTGSALATPPRPVPLTLCGPSPAAALPAYANVLLDILRGGSTLSVGAGESEAAWRILTPVLEGWAEGRVPLEEYPAGSNGPG